VDSIPIHLIGSGMTARVHSPVYRELSIFCSRGLPRLWEARVCTHHPKTGPAAAAAAPDKSLIFDTLHACKHVHCDKRLPFDGAEARALVAARTLVPARTRAGEGQTW
jgi:hypothetical protein